MTFLQSNEERKKICFVTSTAMTINAFLQEPIRMLAKSNEVYVATNLSARDSIPVIKDPKKIISIPLKRKISLVADVVALFGLVLLLRKHQFDIVHSMTPKAGFLVMVASFFARVPVRIHTFTGQVWCTKKGFSRFFLKQLDKVTALFATHILVDSPTQYDFLLDEGVINKRKASVLGIGSVSGVDLNKFKPNLAVRNKLRSELNFSEDDVVVLFLGRLTADKGMLDLVLAFAKTHANRPFVRLLIVGPDEENLLADLQRVATNCIDSIHHVGFTDTPQHYMAASDLLCLPSYREGFGGVVIEAAAVGIPAVGSRIYGLMDAIAENKSGLLFEAKDVSALNDCLMQLVDNKQLRLRLGQNAKQRAESYFSSKVLVKAWLDYYRMKL